MNTAIDATAREGQSRETLWRALKEGYLKCFNFHDVTSKTLFLKWNLFWFVMLSLWWCSFMALCAFEMHADERARNTAMEYIEPFFYCNILLLVWALLLISIILPTLAMTYRTFHRWWSLPIVFFVYVALHLGEFFPALFFVLVWID